MACVDYTLVSYRSCLYKSSIAQLKENVLNSILRAPLKVCLPQVLTWEQACTQDETWGIRWWGLGCFLTRSSPPPQSILHPLPPQPLLRPQPLRPFMELRKEPRLREGKGGCATHTARMSCIPCVDPVSDAQGGEGERRRKRGCCMPVGPPLHPSPQTHTHTLRCNAARSNYFTCKIATDC